MPRAGAITINSGLGLRNLLINSRHEFNQRRAFIVDVIGQTATWAFYMDRFLFQGFTNWQALNTNYNTSTVDGPFETNAVRINDIFGTTRFGYGQRVENIRFSDLAVGEKLTLVHWLRKAEGFPSLPDYNLYMTYEVPGSLHSFNRMDGMAAQPESVVTAYDSLPGGDAAEYLPLQITFTLTQAMKDNGLQVGMRMVQDNEGGVADNTGSFFDLGPMILVVGETDGSRLTRIPRAGRNYDEELELCQRYVDKSYDLNTAVGTPTSIGRHAFQTSATFHREEVSFKTRKRAQPVVSVYGHLSGAPGVAQRDGGTAASLGSFTNSEKGFTAQGGTFVANVEYSFQWLSDAEL